MIVGITVLSLIILIATFFLGFKAGYKECLKDISEENENPNLATNLKSRAVEEATIQEFRTVQEGEYESKFKPGDRVKFRNGTYEAMFYGAESEGRIIDYDKVLKMYEVNVIVRKNGRIVATRKSYLKSEMIKIETEQPEEVNNE